MVGFPRVDRHPYDYKLGIFKKAIKLRQKKPRKIMELNDPVSVIGTDPKVVQEFLDRSSFNISARGNKHRELYEYIRRIMLSNLNERQSNDPTFGILIERISRMSVILDKLERKLWDQMPKMSEQQICERLGSPYLQYLKEFRSFIETFSNLRWAEDRGTKTKTIEKILKITRESDDSSLNTQNQADASNVIG